METTDYHSNGSCVNETEETDFQSTATGEDQSNPSENDQDSPEGGWGWVVTFSAFMVHVIIDGIAFTFGLFFRDILVYFDASKSETSWIVSTLNGSYLGIGPIAGILVNIFGCRKVAISGAFLAGVSFLFSTWSPTISVMILMFGFLGGAGLGLLYLPPIVMVGFYFKKKRALATGIAICGTGIGTFMFAPLCEYLIDTYGWQGAIWIISGITLNGIPTAALLRPVKQGRTLSRRELNNSKSENKTCSEFAAVFDYELLKRPTFLVYGCSCFTVSLGVFVPFTFLPDLANELGMTSREGAILISIIGALNTVARIFVGWLADRPWTDTVIINSCCLIIGGVATACVPLYEVFSIMAIYCVVFGIIVAVFVAYRSIIMAELLGIEKLTSSFGLVIMCQGIAATIGSPIAGALSDMTGDYNATFYMAGITMALGGLICIPLRRISKWEDNRRAAATKLSSSEGRYESTQF